MTAPEQDWLERLRRAVQDEPAWYVYQARVWPLLCDVVEAAQVTATEHADENPFVGYSVEAQADALAALKDGSLIALQDLDLVDDDAALDMPHDLTAVQDAYWLAQREWEKLDEAYRIVVADMLARLPAEKRDE